MGHGEHAKRSGCWVTGASPLDSVVLHEVQPHVGIIWYHYPPRSLSRFLLLPCLTVRPLIWETGFE